MGELDRSELIEYFIAEAEDYVNTLSGGIQQLAADQQNISHVEDLFRAAHTLKGAAAIVKFNTIRNISHKMEDVLEELKDKKLYPTQPVLELLSYLLDNVKDLIQNIAEGKPENTDIEAKVITKTDELLKKAQESQANIPGIKQKSEHTVSASETALPTAQSAPAPAEASRWGKRKEDSEFFTGNFIKYDVRKIEEMLNLIGEITIMKNYLIQKTKTTETIADEIFFSGRRLLKEVTNFADKYAYSLPANVKYVDPLLSEFGELEFDRYDELNLFSRKLQEITNDINEALSSLTDFFDSFDIEVKQIGNMLTMLRYDITEMRMLEIGRLFQRFVRPIKDLAGEAGKNVDLKILGSDTKIDKIIFEKLFEPLMHIIRNAVAHGIETTDQRLIKGKPAQGSLTLSARRDGNAVLIEIIDDGKGIDTEKLVKEAVSRNLLGPNDILSDEEKLSLIFVPGLSTSSSADMVSGRGMGMSAVSSKISDLSGTIEINASDQGTTFKIRIPSSLAITNAMVFMSANMEFLITANVIEEIIQIEPSSEAIGSEASTINYRGKTIQSKYFSELFGIPKSPTDTTMKFAVVCNISDKKVAIIVDKVIAQEETIIKPMNEFLSGLYIYSGATISGDGTVRFVVNPAKVFESQAALMEFQPIVMEKPDTGVILVVDDSLSIRKYASSFLEQRNFTVITASNGLEALNILQENDSINLIMTDLEMPLMHGYELMAKIKENPRLSHLPIIVLTSRSADKHKEKAISAGASDFLVKPFDENTLSDILKKHFQLTI
ncbi:MAG: response regulator [Dissulfurispiraceae bacterium]|jgi:chemosensory pili system protein ChpA (sensor histidine kinase/response regulator)|nr:response regulator [Dissulfurispiraceae bacterium]